MNLGSLVPETKIAMLFKVFLRRKSSDPGKGEQRKRKAVILT